MNYFKNNLEGNKDLYIFITVPCMYTRPVERATQWPICRMMYDRNKTSLPAPFYGGHIDFTVTSHISRASTSIHSYVLPFEDLLQSATRCPNM